MATIQTEPKVRLSRDLKQAASTLGREEARYLVDSYYQLQEGRKSLFNQARSLTDSEEPHSTIGFFAEHFLDIEKQMIRALDEYSTSTPLGEWARSIHGIGPVIAAGLLAHIDVSRTETAGGVWRFAGLDPTSVWNKGEKRPWNADLKVLCWKLGDSFVKLSGSDKCFYGGLYRLRKESEEVVDAAVREVPGPGWYEVEQPTRQDGMQLSLQRVNREAVEIRGKWFVGGNAATAAKTLQERNIRDAATVAIYGTGHLPPGRLDLRARRWAVKLFLAHYHEVGYTLLHGRAPVDPYPISHLGHVHRILPPNWPI